MCKPDSGPWILELTEDDEYQPVAIIVDKDGELIATVSDRDDQGEILANGRILALAPEMLAVLRALCEDGTGDLTGEKRVWPNRAAHQREAMRLLDQAEGKTP